MLCSVREGGFGSFSLFVVLLSLCSTRNSRSRSCDGGRASISSRSGSALAFFSPSHSPRSSLLAFVSYHSWPSSFKPSTSWCRAFPSPHVRLPRPSLFSRLPPRTPTRWARRMPSSPSNASKELLNTPTSPATRLGEREGSEGGSSVEDGAAFPGPEGVLGRGEVHETERYGREEEAERRLGEGGGRVEELGEEEEERDSTPRASLELLSHSSEKVYDAPTRHEQEEEGEPTLSPITAPPHWTFTPSSPSPLSSFPLTSPSLSPSRPSTAQHRLTDPPTPLAVPGGWSSSRWTEAPLRWRVLGKGKGRASDEDEEGEEEEDEGLVLPPPFLADDSPKESFDGPFLSVLPCLS